MAIKRTGHKITGLQKSVASCATGRCREGKQGTIFSETFVDHP